MNHRERCQLLLDAFTALGYGHYTGPGRGTSSQPDNCDRDYMFYPGTNMHIARNYQMFRGYVHDTLDIIYLRINIPGIHCGLGQTPLELDLRNPEVLATFSKKVDIFCQKILVSVTAVDHLMQEYLQRRGSTKKKETVPCQVCEGTGKYNFVYEDDCKVCRGKGTRTRITEQYYLEE